MAAPSRIRIVTDSAADLPPELVAAHAINVVPLSVHFGPKSFQDGVDINSEQFFELLKSSPEFPRTSQPSIGQFEQVYSSLRAEGADVISIHLASKLSGTLGGAIMAAKMVEGLRIQFVDSQSGSMGEGVLVLAAAELAARGAPAAEIVGHVEAMRERTSVAVMVDNLTHLQRGGRIGRAQSLLGTLLNVKPVLSLVHGEVAPRQRVRTVQRALQAMADEVRDAMPLETVRIMHAQAEKHATEFQALLERITGFHVPIGVLGPVISTHSGEGCVGCVIVKAVPA